MQIYLLLTERCNLNCKMCIRGEKTYKELSLKDLYESRMIEEFTKHDIVITGGVTIGEGSVIAAGSVVTKDIPANSLAAGNPCRVIREINEEDSIKYKSELF